MGCVAVCGLQRLGLCKLAVSFKVLECAVPIPPIAEALRVLVPFLAKHTVVVEEVRIKFVRSLEAEAPVMQFYDSLCPDSVRKFEGLLVLLLICSRLFRNEVEVQILVAAFPIEVNVEV